MKNISLACQGYTIERTLNVVHLEARLVLRIPPRKTEEIAEALKLIELYFAQPVNLVKAVDKPRCYYCAGLNDEDAKKCEHCGALT